MMIAKGKGRGILVLLIATALLVVLACASACAQGAVAQGPTSHQDPVAPILVALGLILLAAKLGGEIFERFRQPSVLGELVFGILLGNIVLVNPSWNFFEPLRAGQITEHWAVVIDALARIGVILLLFEVGLESTVSEMRKVGLASTIVAAAGVVAPFILGYGASAWFIHEVPASILAVSPGFSIANIHMFVGAILCATSVGITARVFRDLGKMHLPEARIILGAAVIDDIFGLIILAVVSGLVVAAETGREVSVGSLLEIGAVAFGFLAGAILVGIYAVPRYLSIMARFRTRGVMIVSALLFCFLLSYLANLAGLATIVGAFAAGLVLERVHFKEFKEERSLNELLAPVTTIFVPIFFVMMGIQVRLESFADMNVLGIALALTAAAVIGKQVCGLVVGKGYDRLSIGIGMIPRGEVGLIFASIGKSLNVIDASIFSAAVIMVILTTLITPPLLKLSLQRFERRKPGSRA